MCLCLGMFNQDDTMEILNFQDACVGLHEVWDLNIDGHLIQEQYMEFGDSDREMRVSVHLGWYSF